MGGWARYWRVRGPRRAAFLAAAAVLTLASTAVAALPHRLVVGAVDDGAKYSAPAANVAMARAANFRVLVLSSVWASPELGPDGPEVGRLQAAVVAAHAAGITPIVAVYSFAPSTPLTDAARAQFVSYVARLLEDVPGIRYVSIGNEPNTPQFWRPQFGPGGSDAAAAAYFRLLAEAYDVVKAVSPQVQVIGGSLAAHGSDRPAPGGSHSPTRFLRDLGAAYRASGRTRPVMDLFSLHPYPPNSSIPPTAPTGDPTSLEIGDYPKLVALLRAAFGHPLPIVYGEYGIQTSVPGWADRLYSGVQPHSKRAVGDAQQAIDYREALALAACQPLVRMLIFFHVTDDRALDAMQTGLYYPNHAPKQSLGSVARSVADAERGRLGCLGSSAVRSEASGR